MGLAGGGAFVLVTNAPPGGRVVRDAAALRGLLAGADAVALAPTMGGIHDGHLAVARRARELADRGGRRGAVVASVYVNPLQFAPNEDFADYPRPFAADCEKLARYADYIFAPDDAVMFPEAQEITVAPPPMARELCGRTRPHFFGGVATVVAKLFNLISPDIAVFGKKDYQQWRIIQMLARQMNFPVDIQAAETARASDGLALSSRNAYLTADERRRAPRLYAEIKNAADKIYNGVKRAADSDDAVAALFAAPCEEAANNLSASGFQVEYLEARDAETLSPPSPRRPFIVAAAAALGKTRLIDNIESPPGV